MKTWPKKEWGVFIWRPDARYWAEDAVVAYKSEKSCDRYIARNPGHNYVARTLHWKLLSTPETRDAVLEALAIKGNRDADRRA